MSRYKFQRNLKHNLFKIKFKPDIYLRSLDIILQSSQVLHLNKVNKEAHTFLKFKGNFRTSPDSIS